MASLGDMLFLLVAFAVLMVLVGKFAWGPVTKMMGERSDKINNDLDYAENARTEAQALAEKRQAELKNSQADAVKIVSTAKQNGEKQRQEIVDAAHAEVATLKSNAQQDIAQQKADALNSAKDDVAELSLAIATKIIGKELNADDQQALIDGYIKGLGDVNGTH
ncbi:F0F1 ATP synthase subunit B [Lacticaseibacillus manihotivorans]|jgi:F-type H+-transporting ATPase subunit b|uniref:ATP synthase subunit b n=2 Tax=Lacticaseibacillus manihotivorans TaxID=88233 RepID=A0A0R1R8J8_9LACO|nr:F0F1 ATP synthase subunit B [Lacticaseibacillus manihotivorans]KRL53391.1 H(+)-transporting ATPase F(0) B subunit [Lacticaseibacillus manihotivorans DSM 13343 = JCM 12514]QFQ91998.1 F0F1 ATP synthase subunit B [Lacticaseibacillus manihotivorans]